MIIIKAIAPPSSNTRYSNLEEISMSGITLRVALSNGTKITLDIRGNETGSFLKSKIASKTGVPAEQQSLWLGDYPLRDEAPFEMIWDEVCRGNAIDVRIGSPPKERSKRKARHSKKKGKK